LAAAIANIQVLESDQLVERASSMGVILTAGIKELAEAHSIVGAVRSIGMMAALDLVDKHEAGRPLSKYAQRSETILELRDECLRNGLYLRSHQSTLLIMPPLMIDEDDMRAGLEILSTCISRIESRL
jgi:adenosylmethionine-8-amino-7-oxononanoate aminotransferase